MITQNSEFTSCSLFPHKILNQPFISHFCLCSHSCELFSHSNEKQTQNSENKVATPFLFLFRSRLAFHTKMTAFKVLIFRLTSSSFIVKSSYPKLILMCFQNKTAPLRGLCIPTSGAWGCARCARGHHFHWLLITRPARVHYYAAQRSEVNFLFTLTEQLHMQGPETLFLFWKNNNKLSDQLRKTEQHREEQKQVRCSHSLFDGTLKLCARLLMKS